MRPSSRELMGPVLAQPVNERLVELRRPLEASESCDRFARLRFDNIAVCYLYVVLAVDGQHGGNRRLDLNLDARAFRQDKRMYRAEIWRN